MVMNHLDLSSRKAARAVITVVTDFIFYLSAELGCRKRETGLRTSCCLTLHTFQWMEEDARDDGYGSSHIIACRIKQAAVAQNGINTRFKKDF